MPTIQILRNGQITLPAKIREALNLSRYGFLDVKLKKGKIELTPTTLLNDQEIKKELSAILKNVRERNKDFSGEEVERDVADAIKAVREQARKEDKC